MTSQAGRGTIENEDGTTRTGEFVDGRAQGEATVKYASGSVYTGDLKNGAPNVRGKIPNGRGKMEYANGIIYEGNWKDGSWHGTGKLTLPCGISYEGEFSGIKGGKFHGKGKFRWSKGNEYSGDFLNGKKHGQGKFKYANGDAFTGEWVDDKVHGTGTHVEASTGRECKVVYNNGTRLYNHSYRKRPSRPIQASRRNRPRTDQGAGAVKPDEYDTTCTICCEKFTFDTSAADEGARRRLPVLGWACAHRVCHGCVLKQQLAAAEANKPLPRWIKCMHCREKNAFCPSEPRYHTELIDALSYLASAEEERPE